MQLELAIVLSCTEGGCLTQLLETEATRHQNGIDARYSDPMREHGITTHPGQLVAVDRISKPPRIVYRYSDIQVVGAGSSRPEPGSSHPVQLIRDGQPVDPEQLRDETFPSIRALYARLAAARDIDPKRVVERGYDHIAERYLEWAKSDASGMRERYAGVLLQELPPGARVLELGCGAGVPITRMLVQHFKVTGIDISARQIALARKHVPQAQFVQADMAELDLPPESYDAVVALYSLIHVPREQQPQLFRDIASWLRLGGLLVATMGTQASSGDIEEDWLGAPMYWSSYDSTTNVRLVQEAGLEVIQAREETIKEHGQEVSFLWIVARKPGGDA